MRLVVEPDSYSFLASTFFTVVGYHLPPRAVVTPVLFKVSAICWRVRPASFSGLTVSKTLAA